MGSVGWSERPRGINGLGDRAYSAWDRDRLGGQPSLHLHATITAKRVAIRASHFFSPLTNGSIAEPIAAPIDLMIRSVDVLSRRLPSKTGSVGDVNTLLTD